MYKSKLTVRPIRYLASKPLKGRLSVIASPFSTTTATSTSTSTSTPPSPTRSRLAIGGSKLSQSQQDGIYPSVIATSLQNSITTFEAGLNGDEKLKRGYIDATMFLKNVYNQNPLESSNGNHNDDQVVKLTGRFGYRSSTSTSTSNDDTNGRIDGDIMQESSNDGSSVYHNFSSQYVQESLEKSPLVGLYNVNANANANSSNSNSDSDSDNDETIFLNELRQNMNINLTYMAHNPEAQGSEMLAQNAPIDETREFIHEKMVEAFTTLEQGVNDGLITSYGVCSNGLSLPSSHPLHLSWEDMLKAANQAAGIVHGHNNHNDFTSSNSNSNSNNNIVANLSMVQLPVNLLETHGLKVANRIKNYLASPNLKVEENLHHLPSSINVYAMRPLTCYPDRGTGTGHPFKLVDHLIPTTLDLENGPKVWTHEMQQGQQGQQLPLYTAALNETMAHFDATHILESKEEEERELTMEERETIDGCKLLQSMIHDLDVNLTSGQIRSFAAYEEDLFTKVVPLIHDTFEELDGHSADLLQRFFQLHGNAVRCSIAKTTRQLLKGGGEGVGGYDIDDEMPLQEFALDYLWKQTCTSEYGIINGSPLIDKLVVGCPKAEHVIEAVKIADKFDSMA